MASKTTYIYQQAEWPKFYWNNEKLTSILAAIRHRQGRLLGNMEALGFRLQSEAMLESMTINVIKTSEIEGEILHPEQVRSSIARRLGIDIGGAVNTDRNIDGVVEMMLDATRKFSAPLTEDRLFNWHAALFPAGKSGICKIATGAWRDDHNGPMQVVSGGYGNERVHFEAPAAADIPVAMSAFLEWFNTDASTDPVLKAAIAHLWLITIHPFEDGNGRIARAVADMQLARADDSPQRFYSMTARIQMERNDYYNILEASQKGTTDITPWLQWFLGCLDRSLDLADVLLKKVLDKAKFWDRFSATVINERQKLMLNKLLDGFEGKLTSSKWAKLTKCSQDTALRDMQDLLDKGALKKEDAGGRSTAYALAV